MILHRPHLAIVCQACGKPGAVAAVALGQAARLARYFRITLVSDSCPATLGDQIRPILVRPSSFDWLRRYSHVPRELAFARSTYSALKRLHKSDSIDFVLCHGHAVATLAALPLHRFLNVPFGLVTHGDIFDRPAGTYDPYLTFFYKSVTPKAYQGANLIVALSPYMQMLAERSGANKNAICLIPNGLDLCELDLPADYVSPPPFSAKSPFRILFVGRLSVEKGVDTLIHACRALVDRNILFELRLIGDGPLRSDLECLAQTLAVADHLRFVGTLPRIQLGSEYLNSHVVCVPSRSEPFGVVLLEAMAAGRPVIGTNVGGIPFVVSHQTSGIIVQSEAPIELATALEHAAMHPHALHDMGRHGREIYLERFSWESVAEKLSEAIIDACERAVTRT